MKILVITAVTLMTVSFDITAMIIILRKVVVITHLLRFKDKNKQELLKKSMT